MTDFASLAMKIDSTEVERGVGSLDKLTTAGTRAEGAVDRLGDSAAQTGTQMRGAGVAASEYAAAAQRSAAGAVKVGESGKFASHHVQNLAFQINDLVVGLASGQRPMTVFMQQGSQIGQIMGQAGVGVGGLVKQVGGMVAGFARAHPIIAGVVTMVGAAAGALNIFAAQIDKSGELQKYVDGLGLTRKEMEKLGPVSVTAGDAIKGLWKTISDGLGLDRVFSAIADYAGKAFRLVLEYGQKGAAGIYAAFVGSYRGIAAIWSSLPSVLGEAAIGAANLAITGLEKMVNTAIDGLNRLLSIANPLLEAVGMGGMKMSVGKVSFGRIANPFSGSAANAAGAFKSAYSGAYSEALSGMKSFGNTLSDNILGAAKDRLKGKAEELFADRATKGKGSKAAKAGKEVAFDFKDAANEVLASMVWVNEQAKASFSWANDNDWQELQKDIAEQGKKTQDRMNAAAEATVKWREELQGVADTFKQIGGLAGGLGTAAEVLSSLSTNNYSNLGGPIGLVLGRVASTQVKNKDGSFETLGDRIEKIFDKDGAFSRALGSVIGELGAGAATASLIFGAGNKQAQIGGALGGLGGYLVGGPIGALVGAIGGGAIGGLFKEIKPSIMGGLAGAGLGQMAAGALIGGPIGMIAGALIGGVLGALGLGKAKYGTANVRGLGAATIVGNNKTYQSNAGASASGLQDALSQIADTLGGGVGGFNVSIGQYKGKWRVSPSGMTGKLNKGDTVDFGKDGAEAAVRYALANAIADGAITGISASIQKLIQGSGDIEKQLSKALKFQGVFDELKSKADPLAYSLGKIAREATSLNKIFAEAGATAEEYAQLEQLLAIKRKEAAEQARKDVIDKIREPYDLYTQMLELMGKSEEALAAQRLIELATLKDSLQPLQAWVYQMQDARKVIETFQPLADDLIAYRKELLGGASAQSYGTLAAQFRATAIAAGNGDVAGLGNLRGAASAFLDAAKENAGSALEFQRAQAEVIRAVDKGIFAAETQVDYAQAQLDAINNSAQIMQKMAEQQAAFSAQITENTGLTARLLKRFEGDGGLMVVTPQDEPLQVQVVA